MATVNFLVLVAAVVVGTSVPATARPFGLVLVDVEGSDADYLAKVGIRGAAPMLQAIVKKHPETIVAAQTIEIADDEHETRFSTLPPPVIPKAGVPATAYILKHRLGGPGITGTLRYIDFTRKSSSPQSEPSGPGVAVDSKAIAFQLSKQPIMYVYGALTRARNHGSRFLVAILQPDTPVKVDELAGITAYAGAGVR